MSWNGWRLVVSSCDSQEPVGQPKRDTRKLTRVPDRPLKEPDSAASCIYRVEAGALADDQETRFGICPEAAYGRGESQPQRTPALARY
ncbi:hypothetical protein D3C75_147970 [compost metagenome]